LVLAGLALAPARALASFDCCLSVSQPIGNADCGCYVLVDVAYHEMCDYLPPGYEVTLITRPNCVLRDGRCEERNAARQEGLAISADLEWDWRRLPKRGDAPYLDTLRVRLDAAETVRRARAESAAYRAGRDSVAAFLGSLGDTDSARRVRQSVDAYPTSRLGMVPRLVRATLDCIVDAASRSRIPVRFVTTTVLGDRELAELSRTDAVPSRSPKRAWEY
jgi:hypothetical protein